MVKDATDDSEATATIGDWLLSIGYPQSDRPRASLRDGVSKIPCTWGSTKAACQSTWGRGRQAMHLPCKQADVGALPADSTNFG